MKIYVYSPKLLSFEILGVCVYFPSLCLGFLLIFQVGFFNLSKRLNNIFFAYSRYVL